VKLLVANRAEIAVRVMATAAVLGIRIQRAHLQQARHVRRLHGPQQPGGEFDVRAPETRTVVPGLVEYADQIDGNVAALETAAQELAVVHITDRELYAGQGQ